MAADPLFEPTAVERLLADGGLDAIVATSPQQVIFLSGYGTWLGEKLRGWMSDPTAGNDFQAGFALLDRSLRVGLVASPLFAEEAESSCAAKVVYPERPTLPTGREQVDALVGLIASLGLDEARLGVEFDGAPPALRQQMEASLPDASILDCSWLLRLARQRKNSEALRRLRDAKDITLRALREALRGSATPDVLAARFGQALAIEGADLDHVVHGMPGGNGLSLGRTQARWPEGLVYLDAGARRAHFYSDVGRTVYAAGQASRADTRRLATGREALAAGAAALAPGVRCSYVYRAMADVVASDPALRAQGHGLGLDIRELPMIRAMAPDSVIADETLTTSGDITLEAGMVVNLEISGFFTTGSLQIEETFEIRADGGAPLGHSGAGDGWELTVDPHI